ncbi:MAG: hypothetical protein JSR47_15690 [Proteobacteria bacterium]|nr:hypothetical protein [Pseudomonadota bacterium]MBS0546303.1 hypothetical protein [Pseudomonadota bacterium]
MTTRKRRIGEWLVGVLGVNPETFWAVWIELRAAAVRIRGRIDPRWIARRHELMRRRGVLANLGCGPTGREGWVNLDLFDAPGLTMRVDCRHRLPLADGACRGLQVEHYFEHLEIKVERPRFLAECRRVLEENGILRIVVPDARRFMEAYLRPGWEPINRLGGFYVPEELCRAKIEVVTHTFRQDGDHFAGYDADYLRIVLEDAGFRDVAVRAWREGEFPGGCIDIDQHRVYSLYMEARR